MINKREWYGMVWYGNKREWYGMVWYGNKREKVLNCLGILKCSTSSLSKAWGQNNKIPQNDS